VAKKAPDCDVAFFFAGWIEIKKAKFHPRAFSGKKKEVKQRHGK
jgi:hypothetical protein